MKIEYQKITNLLGTTSNEVPRFITKKWIEVHGQPVVLKKDTNRVNK